MVISTELVQIENIEINSKQKIRDLIFEIEIEIGKFYNKINTKKLDPGEVILRFQECVLHYRKAKNILRNFLKPEENPYISVYYLGILDENLGRVDKTLDDLQDKIITNIGVKEKLERSISVDSKIERLRNMLEESMDSIVVKPLINSANKYNLSDGEIGFEVEQEEEEKLEGTGKKKKRIIIVKEKIIQKTAIEKDLNLFNYYLFKEVYHSSQSVGSFTRQEFKSFPKNIKLINPESDDSENKSLNKINKKGGEESTEEFEIPSELTE